MTRLATGSFAPRRPVVVMADRLDDSPAGRAALAATWWAAATRQEGVPVSVLTWHQGPSAWAVPSGVAVRAVETINSWALPRELARLDVSRPAARLMRQTRVKGWWRAAGPAPAVISPGRLRDELGHYIPSGASAVVTLDADRGDEVGGVWGAALRTRLGVPKGVRLVGGSGLPAWSSGIDQFVAAAAHDPEGSRFVWFGPRGVTLPAEVRHDIGALGVADRCHYLTAPGEPAVPLHGCDVVLRPGRSSRGHDDIAAPVVAYDTPDVPAPAARPEQLADAVIRTTADRFAAAPFEWLESGSRS